MEYGWNFHTGDAEYTRYKKPDGGNHLGIGLGYIANDRFLIEGKCTIDSGHLTNRGDPDRSSTYSIIYGKFSLSIGCII